MTGPATPPTPPLKAFPPITTAVIELRVIGLPISALPDPLNMVRAIPAKAAIRPEITYVLNCTMVTGTAVSDRQWSRQAASGDHRFLV